MKAIFFDRYYLNEERKKLKINAIWFIIKSYECMTNISQNKFSLVYVKQLISMYTSIFAWKPNSAQGFMFYYSQLYHFYCLKETPTKEPIVAIRADFQCSKHCSPLGQPMRHLFSGPPPQETHPILMKYGGKKAWDLQTVEWFWRQNLWDLIG